MSRRKKVSTQSDAVSVFDLGIIALFLSRFLLPTEAAERGMTLWISSLWFLVWVIRAYFRYRDVRKVELKWSWLDVSVTAIVGGHLLSGLFVLVTSGDKRAALNLMWEWGSLGIVFWELKRLLATETTRRLILCSLVVTGGALSALGLWQHFVWYKSQAADVTELLELHDKQASQILTVEERGRYQRLSQEHGASVLNLDKTGRTVFLARVRASVEPIGRFALANTFGGFLVVLCLLIGAATFQHWNSLSTASKVSWCLTLTVMLATLLLTKSRTALLGLLFGVGCYVVFRFFGKSISKPVLHGIVIGVIVLTVLVTGLSVAGGLDMEVLSEAPKSLQYRLEYWTATLQMLMRYPVFGVGPGNFRQHYLEFKLPGSSEEILDPHNLFLDVWANGGLLALSGLIKVGFLLYRNGRKEEHTDKEPSTKKTVTTVSLRGPLLMIGLITAGLVLGYEYVFMGIADTILFWLMLTWLGIAMLFSTKLQEFEVSPFVAKCSIAALGLHLCGAGGIGMPAITQLFLLLLLLALPNAATWKQIKLPAVEPLFAAVVCLLLSIYTALVPHIMSNHYLEIGQYELVVKNQPARAAKTFQTGLRYDTYNAELIQQLATAQFTQWMAEGRRDEELFRTAATTQRHAITRDPRSPNRLRTFAEFCNQAFDVTNEIGHAETAHDAMLWAAIYYPSSSIIQAEVAQVANVLQYKEEASMYAQKALELDAINRKRGHVDKLLSDEIVKQLEEILAVNGE